MVIDGTPYTLKGVRTVWNGGKLGDNIKELPIVIVARLRVQHSYHSDYDEPLYYAEKKLNLYSHNQSKEKSNSHW